MGFTAQVAGRAQELSTRSVRRVLDRLVAVPVHVGEPTAKAIVCDFAGRRLCAPFDLDQDRVGLAEFVARANRALSADVAGARGLEAYGHYP